VRDQPEWSWNLKGPLGTEVTHVEHDGAHSPYESLNAIFGRFEEKPLFLARAVGSVAAAGVLMKMASGWSKPYSTIGVGAAGAIAGAGLSNSIEGAIKGTVTDQFRVPKVEGVFNIADVALYGAAPVAAGAMIAARFAR
jgi:lipoprotein signal peptidase